MGMLSTSTAGFSVMTRKLALKKLPKKYKLKTRKAAVRRFKVVSLFLLTKLIRPGHFDASDSSIIQWDTGILTETSQLGTARQPRWPISLATPLTSKSYDE